MPIGAMELHYLANGARVALAKVGDEIDQTGRYEHAFFVVVDLAAQTFATFRAEPQEPALIGPPGAMLDYLEQLGRADDFRSLELDSNEDAAPVPEPLCDEMCFCSGQHNARIRTYDPANIYLTETRVLFSFLHSGREPPCRFFSYGNTSCWADPLSELFTSWFVTGCAEDEDYPIIYTGWGQYINWDFGTDNKATHVDQGAQMDENGTIWWWHSDWGEGSGFLYGVVNLWGHSDC